jgi:hypothetical protein
VTGPPRRPLRRPRRRFRRPTLRRGATVRPDGPRVLPEPLRHAPRKLRQPPDVVACGRLTRAGERRPVEVQIAGRHGEPPPCPSPASAQARVTHRRGAWGQRRARGGGASCGESEAPGG